MVRMFWDVDTQRDFIFKGGKLYVPGSEEIVKNLESLSKPLETDYEDLDFKEHVPNIVGGIVTAGSVDSHIPNDKEFEKYPEHCIYGTEGQLKIPKTIANTETTLFVPNYKLREEQIIDLVFKAYGRWKVLFEKNASSCGVNPNLNEFINRLNPAEVMIYGVVTEICVDAAVTYFSKEQKREVYVVEDAIKELSLKAKKECFRKWSGLGVKRVSTDYVLGREGYDEDSECTEMDPLEEM